MARVANDQTYLNNGDPMYTPTPPSSGTPWPVLGVPDFPCVAANDSISGPIGTFYHVTDPGQLTPLFESIAVQIKAKITQ